MFKIVVPRSEGNRDDAVVLKRGASMSATASFISTSAVLDRIDPALLQRFQASLRGQLIRSEDFEYDDARSLYNAMIDKRPALIVRCADVADVIAAVNFAREQICCSRSGAVGTMARVSVPATMAWSSISP
jgi:hypothetical protein